MKHELWVQRLLLVMLSSTCLSCGDDGSGATERTVDAGTDDGGMRNGTTDADTSRDGGVDTTACVQGSPHALSAQGDKLLVVGQREGDVLVARYLQDGDLDLSFGEAGVLTYDLGGTGEGFLAKNEDAALGLTVTDTNVWVAGYGRGFAGGEESSFALLKLSSEGALDTSFGDGGFRLVDVGVSARFHTVQIDAMGRPWATGTLEDSSGTDLVIARFTPEGPLDTSFPAGPSNGVILDRGGYEYGLHGLLTPDGIVAGGHTVLTRIDESGVRDDSFGEAGWFESTGGGVQGLLALDDGNMLVAGFVESGEESDRNTLRLTRLTPDGQPDTTFGEGGTVEQVYDLTILTFEDGQRLDGSFTFVRGLQATADGGFLLYTTVFGGLSNAPVLLRLAANGDKVLGFGQQGVSAISGSVPLLRELSRAGGSSQLVTTDERFWLVDELVETNGNCLRLVGGQL